MTQASILVVEDEHIVAKDIATRLTRRGYTVVAIASTAAEAIDEAGRHRGVWLLELLLPRGGRHGQRPAMERVERGDHLKGPFKMQLAIPPRQLHRAFVGLTTAVGEEDVARCRVHSHPAATFYLDTPAASELTRMATPWLLGPVDWTPRRETDAVIWLSLRG